MRMLLSRRSPPEAVALGFAIGVGVAFLPVIGMQMLLAALLAAAFKASPFVAMALVWISNPLTFVPLFAFTYRIGTLFVDGPGVERVREQLVKLLVRLDRHALFDLPSQLLEWMKIGRDVFGALLIGGFLAGGVSAVLCYPVVLKLVRLYRRRRDNARRVRLSRRNQTPPREAGPSGDL